MGKHDSLNHLFLPSSATQLSTHMLTGAKLPLKTVKLLLHHVSFFLSCVFRRPWHDCVLMMLSTRMTSVRQAASLTFQKLRLITMAFQIKLLIQSPRHSVSYVTMPVN